MNIKNTHWSVVVLGRWNPAILTPSGIAKRLFKLPEGTPIELQVAIDDLQPFRVTHNGLIVTVDVTSLRISLDEYSPEYIASAAELACNAMLELPETPVSACGINLAFEIGDASVETIKLITTGLDDPVVDKKFTLENRAIRLGLKHGEGLVNLEATLKGEKLQLSLNFHRQSNNIKDLCEWLRQPTDDLFRVENSLFQALKLLKEEPSNV